MHPSYNLLNKGSDEMTSVACGGGTLKEKRERGRGEEQMEGRGKSEGRSLEEKGRGYSGKSGSRLRVNKPLAARKHSLSNSKKRGPERGG